MAGFGKSSEGILFAVCINRCRAAIRASSKDAIVIALSSCAMVSRGFLIDLNPRSLLGIDSLGKLFFAFRFVSES